MCKFSYVRSSHNLCVLTRAQLRGNIAPPIFILCQCQSQTWIEDEGDADDLRYHRVSLSCNYYYSEHREMQHIELVSCGRDQHHVAEVNLFPADFVFSHHPK